MASPISGLVLGSGAVLASPALWAAFVEGSLPMEAAAGRFAVAVLVAWIGFAMLGALVSSTADRAGARHDAPRVLAGIDGPVPVRGAVLDSHVDETPGPDTA